MNLKFRILTIFIIIMFLASSVVVFAKESIRPIDVVGKSDLSSEDTKQIDDFVIEQMGLGKIPGASIVIIKDGKVLYKNHYGYADKRAKKPVASDALFEIGSNSKAYTALGILLLQEQGYISLSDPVKKYIPWFSVKNKKKSDDPTIEYIKEYIPGFYTEEADITIEQLLNHTSGIPFKTIGDIPVADDEEALEKTVRILVGVELEHDPGERYLYATINYDVLGLIIQNVTGQPFEDYIKKNILEPLGLSNTYVGRSDTLKDKMAKGYKVGFGISLEYEAPTYRGNTPAGYIITTADDLARWLMVQLGEVKTGTVLDKVIARSHNVGTSPEGSGYDNGWQIVKGSTWSELSHGGSNPNFSSFTVFRPEERLGVGVLANMDSGYSEVIARGLINTISGGGRPPELTVDTYVDVDRECLMIIAIGVLYIVLSICSSLSKPNGFVNMRRNIVQGLVSSKIYLLRKTILLALYGAVMYYLPSLLFYGLPWSFMLVWAPISLPAAVIVVFIAGIIFYHKSVKKLSLKKIKMNVHKVSGFLNK